MFRPWQTQTVQVHFTHLKICLIQDFFVTLFIFARKLQIWTKDTAKLWKELLVDLLDSATMSISEDAKSEDSKLDEPITLAEVVYVIKKLHVAGCQEWTRSEWDPEASGCCNAVDIPP